MKNKKGLFVLAGVVGAVSAVGAIVGIKKLKSQIAKDEILFREEDLMGDDCDFDDDAFVENSEEGDEKAVGGCGSGCCCASDNVVFPAEEPTENIAEVEDLKMFGIADEIIAELEKEI